MNIAVSSMAWLYVHFCFWDVGIALLGLFIFSCILERRRTKGPIMWPVLGITPWLFLYGDQLHDWASRTLTTAGGTYRYRGIWLGGAFGVTTADPSNIEYMLKTNFNNFPKGDSYRERFHDLLGDGIFNVDGDSWKEQRRMVKAEMHSNRFMQHSFQTTQDLVNKKLIGLTEKFFKSGESFDLQDVLLRFTFDSICSVAFGVDPGSLAIDLPQVPFAKAFEEATELSLLRFMIPSLFWKPMKYFCLGYEKRLKKAIKIVHDFADKTVRDRRSQMNSNSANLNHQSDLLSKLMQIENNVKANGNPLPDKFFRDFCVSFIIAGRDTTSVALSWFFWLLHENPDVESKILSEMKEILGQRKAKTEISNTVFTEEELKQMVYLQATLSETLRLYPSVPSEMKQVVEDDVLPDGNMVKKGARIFFSVFSMGRMEFIWGKDCREFKPERWIKDGQFVNENQFKYVVFNAGPRLCLGKRFAYMQMKMVAASILLRYSVKAIEGHNVAPKVTTTLYMKNGLMVTLNRRPLATE
ncbi:cytochrome P450 86B1-like [Carica papaya]|uniref:cytochrome P450 86B1-like n=1 Tax=Carica papaya TaxID=3649 RepID=UPI000B8C75C1|nr:cytochrome P450 86B1-like [Carica papaya]